MGLPFPIGLITACLFASATLLIAQELAGVVYSDHSGPAADGVGEVQLATKTGLVSLDYQKPVKLSFSKGSCSDPGAVWMVRADFLRGTLISAKCDGSLDRPVHSAWLAVRAYIESLASAAGEEMGYRQDRRGPVRVPMNGLVVDISGYLNFGSSGMCLEVGKRIDSHTVIIRSSADCYFFPDLDFKVREVKSNTWRVGEVTAVDRRRQ